MSGGRNLFTTCCFLLQLILSLPEVEACAVGVCDGSRLLAFVVAPTAGHQMAASTISSVQEDHCPPQELGWATLKRLILNQLTLLLPSHSVPDTLLLVPALRQTPHGELPETPHVTCWATVCVQLCLRSTDLTKTSCDHWVDIYN